MSPAASDATIVVPAAEVEVLDVIDGIDAEQEPKG
jgi:hypothetical protein